MSCILRVDGLGEDPVVEFPLLHCERCDGTVIQAHAAPPIRRGRRVRPRSEPLRAIHATIDSARRHQFLAATFQVVGAVATDEEAVEFVKLNDVDLVLMDNTLPSLSGAEATR